METLYTDSSYKAFIVLGQEINLITDQTDYGDITFADVSGIIYYIGNEPGNLETAMIVWQDLYDRDLTVEELDKVLSDNKVALDAIDGE